MQRFAEIFMILGRRGVIYRYSTCYIKYVHSRYFIFVKFVKFVVKNFVVTL